MSYDYTQYPMYSFFDKKTQLYSPPQFFQSEEVAERAFSEFITYEDSPVSRAIEDFSIFKMGVFDLRSGEFVLPNHPCFWRSCFELRRKPNRVVRPEVRSIESPLQDGGK